MANFKQRLSLVPRWVPSCTRVLTSNSTIPKLSPVLIGNLSAGYLHTGDLFVQVFPQMNPQVPVKVLVLVLSPSPKGPKSGNGVPEVDTNVQEVGCEVLGFGYKVRRSDAKSEG